MDGGEAAPLAELRALSAKSSKTRFEKQSEKTDQENTNNLNQDQETEVENKFYKHDEAKNLGNNLQISTIEEYKTTKNLQNEEKAKQNENFQPSSKKKEATDHIFDNSNECNTITKFKVAKPENDTKITSKISSDKENLTTNQLQIQEDQCLQVSSTIKKTNNNFRSDLPKTFKGDRGGSAEDADLLAELRAISSKSRGDRFSESEAPNDDFLDRGVVGSPKPKMPIPEIGGLPPWKKGKKSSKQKRDVPPWKKDNKEKKVESKDNLLPENDIDAAVASKIEGNATLETSSMLVSSESAVPIEAEELPEPIAPSSSTGGFRSDLPKTFKGDRGGSAEDADLLAELRRISGKSIHGGSDSRGSSTRTNTVGSSSVIGFAESSAVTLSKSVSSSEFKEDMLPDAFSSKDWKIRKDAYLFLHSKLLKICNGSKSNGLIESDTIFDSLDKVVLDMVKDSNAGALDAALKFVLVYADFCSGPTYEDQAAKLASFLLKGPAFSSRPSTTRTAKEILIKLMEVGNDGYTSLHSVIKVLFEVGVVSRKPKIVVASSGLILEASTCFGASSLPVSIVSSNIPKILSNANSNVREIGIKIVAEICRATGSKSYFRNVIEKLKPSQISQIDNLLKSQPNASIPTIGLRSIQSEGQCSSAVDVIKALEESAKIDEAQRLAARPEINLFDALSKTDYSKKIQLAKWSEKTGALDILIRCGGAKPFKLVKPSSNASISYNEIIRDMKKLLKHTHFAVNSKAMGVLQMLCEGVGEKLFPHIRPLLLILTDLSKDKKLTIAASNCLDSFFGKVLSFEHLLENDDALPDALNEKKQKNALARKSTLEFLFRCIKRRESAGPRSILKTDTAGVLSRLVSNKLNDTDAAVRKASIDILQLLLSIDDEKILIIVKSIVEDIKDKNQRAYKSLFKFVNDKAMKTSSKGSISSNSSQISNLPIPKQDIVTHNKVTTKPRESVTKKAPKIFFEQQTGDEEEIPKFEDAMNLLSDLSIPNWEAREDEEGIVAGLNCEF